MKNILLATTATFGIIIFAAYFASAATTTVSISGTDTLASICAKLVTPPTPSPAPTPVPSPAPSGNSITLDSTYLTFYSEADNTPTGSTRIDLGGHTGTLGGDCTYANPTTIAVGFSLAGGKETDDFAYGTRFYVPALQCYFIAADQCGDGPSPQTQPCHQLHSSNPDKDAPPAAKRWLDAYEGPKNSCEDSLTGIYSVTENPVAGLPVKVGSICR